MAGGIKKYSVVEAQNTALGQAGSILLDQSTTDTDAEPLYGVFVAIQFIEDSTFGTLTSETSEVYPASDGKSTSIDADAGAYASAVTFPQGMTIFGRWTKINLATGACIAYVSG